MLALMITLLLLRQEPPHSASADSTEDAESATPAQWQEGCTEGPRSGVWAAAAPVTKTRDTCAVAWHAGETADMTYNASLTGGCAAQEEPDAE